MKCGHCGASNSDRAKFCGKCAVRLRASAANGPIERPTLVPREEDIDTIIQSEFEPVHVDQDAILASSTIAAPPVVPTIPVVSGRTAAGTKTRNLRSPGMFGAYALLIAATGTAGFWLFHGGGAASSVMAPTANNKAPALVAPVAAHSVAIVAPAGAVVSPPLPTPMPPQSKSVSGPDLVVNKNAGEPNTASSLARTNKIEKIKDQRAIPAKRKNETALRNKAAASHVTRRGEMGSSHDIALKNNQNEITRLLKSKTAPLPAQQTPQQACADRSNFISRGICESRECDKPEHLSLKFCVDMRARRAPREFPN